MENALCRISKSPLTTVVDFGRQPLGNGFIDLNHSSHEFFFPMKVGFSEASMMLQLIEQPSVEKMFHERYAFYSSTSSMMAQHFQQFAESVIGSRFFSKHDPFVVELGCNDGIMLKHFSNRSIRHLGIEPSRNVAIVANNHGVRTVSEFFCEELAAKIVEVEGQADAFIAANVMCHIPNIVDVVRGIKKLLKPSGVVMFEDPYLGDILQKTSYDQIYDEHVFLFSALSIRHLFGMHGMELIDLIPQRVHGGSIRYILAHRGAYSVQDVVTDVIKMERDMGLDRLSTFENFRLNVEKSRFDLIQLLKSLKQGGKRVVGYGATSKSTTILNYCGIGPDLIEYISDTTPIKQGKLSPGMHIPVVSHETFKSDLPDYAVLFAWNHAEEIMAKERRFMEKGGKWIVHVPTVRVI